tara:strand:+ start:695 stop:889 length:195 start_codon:yes stop_codon:yes gene_type:complete
VISGQEIFSGKDLNLKLTYKDADGKTVDYVFNPHDPARKWIKEHESKTSWTRWCVKNPKKCGLE